MKFDVRPQFLTPKFYWLQVEGVQMVDFNNTTEHYNQASALFSVTFDYEQTDERCVESLNTIQEMLSDYDTFVSTTVIDTMAETIKKEVNMITAFVAVIAVTRISLLLAIFSSSISELGTFAI